MRIWKSAGLLALIVWTCPSCGSDEGLEREAGGNAPSAGGAVDGPNSSADAGAGTGSGADGFGGQADAAAGAAPTPGGGKPSSGNGPDAGAAADAAGPAPAHGAGRLGSPCVASADCVVGLRCLSAGSAELGAQSVPHGLCTRSCADDDDCLSYHAGASCLPLVADSEQTYCVEGCAFGEPVGAPKCHGRPDFACLPALLAPLGVPCGGNDDCAAGDLCTSSGCAVVLPACLPSCRGDIDCPSGRYCDQAFLSGTCTTVAPEGKALGEPCTVPGAGEPLEPDECLGFCQSDDGGESGHCAASCGLGNGCAFDPEKQQFGGACLYLTALTAEVAGVGDFGFCTPTCSCSSECHSDALKCVALSEGELSSDVFSGPGVCFGEQVAATTIEQCRP